MTVKRLILCYLLFALVIEVRNQVCTRRIESEELRTMTYTSLSEVGHKTKVVVKTMLENVPFTQNVTECCPDYIKKNKNKDPSRANCVQRCESSCKNGHCTDNICICYENYEKHQLLNTCVPKCDTGYIRRSDGNCLPHCSKSCIGGKCVAPGKCSCDSGWYLNEREECVQNEPVCTPPCGNGACMQSNKCKCYDGYVISQNSNPQCVSSQNTCQNSKETCVDPDSSTKVYFMKETKVTQVELQTRGKGKKIPEEPNISPKLNIVVKHTSKKEPKDLTSNIMEVNRVYIMRLGVLIVTTIIMVALIILIIWELRRK